MNTPSPVPAEVARRRVKILCTLGPATSTEQNGTHIAWRLCRGSTGGASGGPADGVTALPGDNRCGPLGHDEVADQ